MADRQTSGKGTSNSEDLAAEIEQLRKDLASLTETLKAIGLEKADSAKDEIRGRAAEFAAAGRRQVESLSGSASEIEAEMARSVREKPLQSLAIAAAVGLVLGLISRRG